MTTTDKPVTRVTRGGLTESYGPDRGRQIVCTLQQGDLLTMRAKGRQKSYTLSLFDVYMHAIRLTVNQTKMEKLRLRKAAKAAARERRRLTRDTAKLFREQV